MIIQFIFNLFIFTTLKKFTACHILIIIVIAELEPFCKDLVQNNFISIIIIIELICILFILLIFNEIIEINCCGLQKNTKKNIIKRAQIELEMSKMGVMNKVKGVKVMLNHYMKKEKQIIIKI